MISTYVCAFLNTDGGTLYYGISDSGIITGIKLMRRVRDLFTVNFDVLLNRFRPSVGPDLCKIKYFNVYNKDRQAIPNTYVIEIIVNKGSQDMIYYTHKEEAYIKRDSSISLLKGPCLVEFSKKRVSH